MTNSERDTSLLNLENEYESIKDYFTSVKFAYRERESKKFFYDNLHDDGVSISGRVLEQSKANLRSVKRIYEEKSESMSGLSKEQFEIETEIRESERERDKLAEEINALQSDANRLEIIRSSGERQRGLEEQLGAMKAENGKTQLRLNETRAICDRNEIDDLLRKERELIERKRELTGEVRRLTVAGSEEEIEEVFCWHRMLGEFYKALFGEVEVKKEGNRVWVTVTVTGRMRVTVTVVGKRVVEIEAADCPESMAAAFVRCRSLCLRIGDPRLAICCLQSVASLRRLDN
ncbi:hypothetical protein ECANGB1_925 [Enterospora canceri]|uniref:Uncharacterized protein n=1 Tax=Enterospora canceri TaxID=1081671 RepID=A0A1Y1S5A2_9MICR|nr:hypothetical protein ECANGB1_925 [Enterospora canceri]